MKNLNIRNMPADLMREAKIAAAREGRSLREWVIKVIEKALGKLK